MKAYQVTRVAVMLATCCLVGIAGHACAEQRKNVDPLPMGVRVHLGKMPQEVRLLELGDMDSSSCGTLKSNPGLVSGDFNGDGRSDYAVLLISKLPKREQMWEGRKLSLVDAWFAFFLQKKDGTFDRKEIERFETNLPSGTGLDSYPAGPVADPNSDRVVDLKSPAVEWYFCEKGASLYYWDGRAFSSISTSD